MIHHDVDTILKAWHTGWYHGIVLPHDGVGTGVAKLGKRAPKTFAFLLEEIERMKKVVEATSGKNEEMRATHSEEERKRWDGVKDNHHLTYADEL